MNLNSNFDPKGTKERFTRFNNYVIAELFWRFVRVKWQTKKKITSCTIIFRCPSVDAAPPCTVVEGNPQIAYPDCCPRVECPSENEINFDDNIDPDQVMMASHPAQVATYDVTLDYDDNYGNFQVRFLFFDIFFIRRQRILLLWCMIFAGYWISFPPV